jgi:hypothetical protein
MHIFQEFMVDLNYYIDVRDKQNEFDDLVLLVRNDNNLKL